MFLQEELITQLEAKHPELFSNADAREKFGRNFLKVSVFYEDLNYESVVELPAYDVS